MAFTYACIVHTHFKYNVYMYVCWRFFFCLNMCVVLSQVFVHDFIYGIVSRCFFFGANYNISPYTRTYLHTYYRRFFLCMATQCLLCGILHFAYCTRRIRLRVTQIKIAAATIVTALIVINVILIDVNGYWSHSQIRNWYMYICT